MGGALRSVSGHQHIRTKQEKHYVGGIGPRILRYRDDKYEDYYEEDLKEDDSEERTIEDVLSEKSFLESNEN